jgi:hypothetical protein
VRVQLANFENMAVRIHRIELASTGRSALRRTPAPSL